jgi:glutamate-1-semialdehyde 2,1-aminomutase
MAAGLAMQALDNDPAIFKDWQIRQSTYIDKVLKANNVVFTINRIG